MQQVVFKALKNIITTASVLIFLDTSASFYIKANSSDLAVEYILF